MSQMPEMMQQKMKQMMENLACYDYKGIRFFEEKDELQKALDAFYNNNEFKNVNSRTLTENYIEEICEMFIFIPHVGNTSFQAGVVEILIGGILGRMQGNTIL